jgi:hypothetical protein
MIGSGNYRDQRNNLNSWNGKSQSSSILEGSVTSINQDNQVVFTTPSNGDFILNNLQDSINTGDHLRIQVKKDDTSGILSGTILKINSRTLDISETRSFNLRNISLENGFSIDTSKAIISPGTEIEAKLLSNDIRNFLNNASLRNGLPEKDLVAFGLKNASLFQSLSEAELGASFVLKTLDTISQNTNLSYHINSEGQLVIDAKLIQQNPFGTKILATPLGLMSVSKEILIPKNRILRLILENVISNSPNIAVINDVVNKSTDFLRKIQNYWPALMKLSKFLKLKSDSKEFEEEVRKMFPGTDSDMLYKIIKYAEAIKSGNIANIIGSDTIAKFKDSGAEDIINELAEDFFELQRIYSTNGDLNNWQTMLIPIFDGEIIQHTKIFTRKSYKDGSGQIRFIVELTLESNGDMQLDGLVTMILGVNKKSKVQKFDLVIRTIKPLDHTLKSGIQEIFINNQKIIGISGAVRFEKVDDFKVNPYDEITKNKQNSTWSSYIA